MRTSLLPACMLCLALPQEENAPAKDPVTRAWTAFARAPLVIQGEILAAIQRRLDASDDPGVRRWLQAAERARAELAIEPAPAPSFYDPKLFARGLVERAFLPAGDEIAVATLRRFRPWLRDPPFARALRYDFGTRHAFALGAELGGAARLWNLLWGYPPDADRIFAWLLQSWDRGMDIQALARHFAHAYCDREGHCFPAITLYDAFASGLRIEMPDVDVIAFERLVLGKHTLRSPIPAGRRREATYEEIEKAFLRTYQQRTFLEAAANLYLAPQAPLRAEHEALRDRILYAFALDGSDVERFGARVHSAGSRAAFCASIDTLMKNDLRARRRIHDERSWRARARASLAATARELLRIHGLLRD